MPAMAIEEAKLTRADLEAQIDPARPAREEQDLMASQNPEMIRASIEETRRELAFSVNDLRSKVAELTDWRRQLAGEPQQRARRRGCRPGS